MPDSIPIALSCHLSLSAFKQHAIFLLRASDDVYCDCNLRCLNVDRIFSVKKTFGCDDGRCKPVLNQVSLFLEPNLLPDPVVIPFSGPASPLKVLIPVEYATATSNDSGGTAADLRDRIRSTASFLSNPASPLRFSPAAASPSLAKQSSPDRWLNHVCRCGIVLLIFETAHFVLQFVV
jgi:hypothetical protein